MKSVNNSLNPLYSLLRHMNEITASWRMLLDLCKLFLNIVDSNSKNCIQYWVVDWTVSVFHLRSDFTASFQMQGLADSWL